MKEGGGQERGRTWRSDSRREADEMRKRKGEEIVCAFVCIRDGN